MDDPPSVVQCLLFGALALLALLPLVSLVCRSTALRECAAEWGWWRCVGCCDRLFGNAADSASDRSDLEAGDRNDHEPRTIAEYYRLLYAPRHTMHHHHPCLALGLTTWREDVRHYVAVRDVFDMKLQQIQLRDQAMERADSSVSPQTNADAELTRLDPPRSRDTMLCGDDEEEEKNGEA